MSLVVIYLNDHITHSKNGIGKNNNSFKILIFVINFKISSCRRWFVLNGSRLLYQKKNETEYSEMEADLRVCKVREVTDLDRRFTFEIFSPKW